MYLVSNLSAPLDHLRYRLLIHLAPRLTDGIDDSEVRLKRVERLHRILILVNSGWIW